MSRNPRERVLRTIRGEPADCVPAAPFMYDLAAVAAGVPLREYYTRAEALVHAQLTLHELVGHDVISVGSDNYYIAEGFGCETTRSDDELPALEQPAVGQLADVFSLDVPDPHTQGRMPMMIQAIRDVRRAVGDSVAIRCPGTGPFALASYLIGTQNWLLEVGMVEAGMSDSQEAALHRGLELAAEALIRFGIACWEAGADIIQCGDSLASCNVISPRTYRRFAWPYQQKVFRAWRQRGIRASLLHICGDSSRVLDWYAETGADLIEIDNQVDLSCAAQRIGGRAKLVGNVHTVTELLEGSRETVRAAAERCLCAAAGARFILGSGCLVPRRTPLDNVRELVQTAHRFRPDRGPA
ncbi:MAG: uroporphyrinogen decarboxylase family protein [Pirellulaceae bacterium]|nr:uroporphyrinogen decarboxylase family protein [Pirellulaceae bacterium]